MRSIVGIFMVTVLMFVFVTTNGYADGHHYIFDDVYPFWSELHKDLIDIYNGYYMGGSQDFVLDGCYYMAGHELGLRDGVIYENVDDYAIYLKDFIWDEYGIEHVSVHISQIGKGNTMRVLYLELQTNVDLRNYEGIIYENLDFDDNSRVFGCKFIYYEHV